MKLLIFVLLLILVACSSPVRTPAVMPPSSSPQSTQPAQQAQVLDAVLTELEGTVIINGQPAVENAQLKSQVTNLEEIVANLSAKFDRLNKSQKAAKQADILEE